MDTLSIAARTTEGVHEFWCSPTMLIGIQLEPTITTINIAFPSENTQPHCFGLLDLVELANWLSYWSSSDPPAVDSSLPEHTTHVIVSHSCLHSCLDLQSSCVVAVFRTTSWVHTVKPKTVKTWQTPVEQSRRRVCVASSQHPIQGRHVLRARSGQLGTI